jgi:quercetin dioxygenase-like cupin family protein
MDVTLKVESDQASGSSLMEIRLSPGFDTGFHVHKKLEETFYVLEGDVTFTAGPQEETVILAGPGATVFVPPPVPHRVANRAERSARCLLIWTPAAQDRTFDELSAILSRGGPPSEEEIADLSARYDTHHISDDAARV